MKRLAILGASGHGKVVADAALASAWEEVVFFDDAWPVLKRVGEWSVIGDGAMLRAGGTDVSGAIVAVGDCSVRLALHTALRAAGQTLVTIVHPRAWVSPRARIGVGSVLCAGAVVNIDAELGEACIVNTGATIDHDCSLGAGVHVAPGANVSGAVRIGDRTWVGVGACVRQGLRIGSDVMVGAGAVVVAPVADGCRVMGNPAREY